MSASFERAKALFIEGIGHFQARRYAAAETAFAGSLVLLPGRASTLANLGAARVQLAKWEPALDALDQALALEPDDLDARSYQGIALAALGRFDEACACHDRVLAVDPERIGNRLHRGRALLALGRHADALIDFDGALQRQPQHAEASFQRGQTLQCLDRHADALMAYETALAFDPTLAQAWSNRGGILRDMQRLDEAAVSYEQALANGADPELNSYFLASVTGRRAPPSAPGAYVEPFFDEYADAFEQHLQALRYEGHTTLVDGLHGLAAPRYGTALDLGCGTGLCGPLVRPITDRLDGVDLSRRMLERAQRLGVYDELVHADVAEHLRRTERRYDLLLSADVFIYVGDLGAVFEGARRVLDDGGVFCFSVEVADDDETFKLLPSLRYAHSERYLRELAAGNGFEPLQFLRRPLREDQRRPVPGLYVYLGKT
jgi:predicted TPR repeat methyltransferase